MKRPNWMTERDWALANAKNERERDRLLHKFHRDDMDRCRKPMREYTAAEMFNL